MNFSSFDFTTLRDIPISHRYYDTPRISISAKGSVSMNGALKKAVGEQRAFRAKLSPDGCLFALYPNESPNIRFSPKGGHIMQPALVEHLEQLGLSLPVLYTLEWNTEQQAWVGCCDELPQPPSISKLSPPPRASKTRRKV